MTELTASISKDGAVVAESVRVDLTVEDSSASRWHGTLRLDPRVPLPLDTSFVLILSDGRRGEAQVTRIAYAGPRDPVRIHFRGTTPLT